MEEEKKPELKDQTKEPKKKFAIRTIIVLLVLAFFAFITIVYFRANYLNTIEINPKYESVFNQKVQNRCKVFGISIHIYIK